MDCLRRLYLTALSLFLLLPAAAAVAGGKPPVVTNEPATTAEIDSVYVYQINAWDPEGDRLTYRIRNAAGWDWLRWDRDRGRLTGKPTSADLGPHDGIRLLVSDGTSTTEIGPFGINVTPKSDRASDASPGWRKKNPGHYVAMRRWDTAADMVSEVKPGIRGFQIRYFWNQLEPSKGNYDFSAIRADLKTAASQGLQLVVFIEDKTFHYAMPTPPYLHDLTRLNRSRGFTALRWKPYVTDRFSALLRALGNAFDSHPNFEGIALQESSLGLENHVLDANGYRPELYRDALIDTIRTARRSFPQSQVFWYMNFLRGGNSLIAEIANVAANNDVAMGGPDVLPESDSLQRVSYPYYDEFKGRMTLFNSMQYDSYAHRRVTGWTGNKYWTMKELFVFARDELHVDYLFWNRKLARKPSDSYSWRDAVNVIGNHQTF